MVATSDETMILFNNRIIPQGFWYEKGLHYSELLQLGPAPVVYVIAGTGADSHAEDMQTLGTILYSAGFSVVLLPSPTHPNFIINASENFLPGNGEQDAKDLYRVMEKIDANIATKTRITGHMLLGYSLGGWNAAFTAKYDDQQKQLNFSRVLLIDPPLSLYSSIKKIDHMLYQDLPSGINGADQFIVTALMRLSALEQNGDALDFHNERTLIEAYDTYKPDNDNLATIIGLSFRLAAANMIFTSDVMGHTGYIFPTNHRFTISTPLDEYLAIALRTSFQNYFDDMMSENYMNKHPGVTRQSIINGSSLLSIADYISHSKKMGLITNKDDIILPSGDSTKLIQLFGKNAFVFPTGGHLGNLSHPAVAWQIVQFMHSEGQ